MKEITIDISELKTEGSDLIKDLSNLLEKKTECQIKTGADELTVACGEKDVTKSFLRVLLRKFLHQQELKDYYKVLRAKDNTLIFKERKISEE